MWCRPSRPGPLRSCRAGSGRLGDRGAAAPGGHAPRRPVAMSWTWAPLLALLLGACLWPACLAAPRDVPDYPMDITDKLENYLVRFGYAQESDPRGPAQMLDLRGAIKKLQAFAGIPVTGTLDPATRELLDKPRCGRRDIETGDDVLRLRHDKHQRARRARRYTVTPQGNKWHTIPVSWSLKTGVPPGLDKRQVIKEVRMALEVWARPANLSFAEDNKSPDIEVRFERGNHHDGFDFDGRGNILAHAFYPGTGLGGDVHLDWDERWLAQTNNPSNGRGGFYLFAVLAHELGHSLGLQHSSVEGAVMNAWYRDGLDAEHFELHEDDTFGIQQIYGPRDGRLWAKLPKYPKYPDYSPSPRPPQRPAIAPPVVPPPALPPLRPHDPAQPAKCNTDFDAAAVIRRETYFFKGKYFWRIQEQNIPEGPHLTERFWYGFDKNYTHIDAVYERIHDNNIVFFVGKKYYVYNGTNLISGYPKPLTELGLPPTLTHIDGAMVWGHNSRTYLFSGTLFWRLDEEVGKVELDYPRDMSMWRGVGYNVDAVLQKHGVTYFFKNKGYWKFDDRHMRVEQCMPKNIAASWMGCKEPEGKWSDWEENYLDILRDSKDCFYDIAVNDDDGDSAACQAINIVVFWLSLLVSFYFAF